MPALTMISIERTPRRIIAGATTSCTPPQLAGGRNLTIRSRGRPGCTRRKPIIRAGRPLTQALGLMRTFFVLLALSSAAVASGTPALPPEIQSYIEERELCEHFREEPADGGTPEQNERREFVRESIEIYCSGTDRRLAALKKRHAGNPAVQSRLEKYEPTVEASCK